jgi:hypothetical protein
LRLKVRKLRDGLHPSETIVAIGDEAFVVHPKALIDGTVDVGEPVGSDGDRYLVELPSETWTGAWRVWVAKDQVTQQ